MRTRSPWRFSLVVGVLMLFVAGCNDPVKQPSTLSDETSPSVESSGPTTTTPNQDPQVQAVSEQYKGYYETLMTLGKSDEATIRAKLAPFATGVAVQRAVDGIAYFRAKNQEPSGTITFGELSVQLAADRAVVQECRDGSTETIIDSSTGDVVSAGQPKQGYETQMTLESDGVWKVTSFEWVEGVC